MDKDAQARLDALVGAALRGLVESGASAEAIGAFANSYREEAAAILGQSPSTPKEPDLQELINQAVKSALSENQLTNVKVSKKTRAKRFYVRIKGRRTSVTISAPEAEQLLESQGGRKQANNFIQQLANNAPHNITNRSEWVRERIKMTLSPNSSLASSQAHH